MPSLEHEIRKSLETFTARLRTAIDRELDQLAAELMQQLEAATGRARAEAESAAEARVSAARAEAEAARAARETELSAREQTLRAELRAEAERGLADREEQIRAAAMAEAFETAQRDQADAAVVQVTEREGRLEAVERLVASVRRLDAASSLRETLEVLVQSASLETPRVAVLLIEGTTVRTFAQRGFTDVPDAGPLAQGGVVEACARLGQPASTADPAGLKAPGFATLAPDRAGFAAPLRVGQRTVAVLYADDAGTGAPEAPAAWPEALELLARHASVHLENLTAVRAVGQVRQDEQAGPGDHVAPRAAQGTAGGGADDDAARRYAKLLVSEIKLYNESTVREGREHRDLRRRLRDEIEHAQRTYLDRIPDTVAARRAYFEAELVETLAGGDASALGPSS